MKIWKAVPGLNGLYEVSSDGEIRRVSAKTKLSADDVARIKSYREQGRSYNSIAAEFGVTKRAIISLFIPRKFSFRTPFRELKIQKSSTGYGVLRISINGIPRTCVVHRAVVEAFIGPIPPGMEVNHINGKGFDNRISNLEIVTPSGNQLHSIHILGNKNPDPLKGSACAHAVLKEADIPEIRRLYAAGYTQAAIGKQYGVTHKTIGRILCGKTWKHVT